MIEIDYARIDRRFAAIYGMIYLAGLLSVLIDPPAHTFHAVLAEFALGFALGVSIHRLRLLTRMIRRSRLH